MIREYILKSFSTGVLTSAGTALVSLLFIPLLVSNMGQEGFGAWVFLNFYIGLAGFGQLGLTKANVLILNDQALKEEHPEYLGGVLTLGLILALLFCGGAFIFSSSLVSSYSTQTLLEHELQKLSRVGAILLSVAILNSIFASIQEARLKVHIVNVTLFSITATNYLAAWLVSSITGSVTMACISTLAVFTIGTILQGYLALTDYVTPSKPSPRHLQYIFRLSLGFVGISIVNLLIIPLNRYLVVVLGGGMVSHALFDTGLKLAMAANRILAMIGVPLLGIFSKFNSSTEDTLKMAGILKKATLLVTILYFSGVLLFGGTGQILCDLLFPDDSQRLLVVSLIMVIGVCTSGVAEPSVRGLWAVKALWGCFAISLVMLLINVATPFLYQPIPNYLIFPISYSLAIFCGSILYVSFFQIKLRNILRESRVIDL